MLSAMNDSWHQVHTAVVVLHRTDASLEFEQVEFVETTRVKFRKLSQEELEWYLDTQEWTDKAGGYGYQGQGMILVERIEGCYYNVVGLPIARLIQTLSKIQANDTFTFLFGSGKFGKSTYFAFNFINCS
jgi:septum formation protein